MAKFTAKAANVINKSQYLASELGHTYIGSEHLLLALTSEADSVAARLLDARGVSFDGVKNAIIARIGTGDASMVSAEDMTPRTKRIIESSAARAGNFSQSYVGTEHLLLALVSESDSMAVGILSTLGASAKDISSDVVNFFGEITGEVKEKGKTQSLGVLRDMPVLSQHGRDLTALAREGKLDPIVGRDKECERVIGILSRRTKNNPCLIGEPGVGKTAVVEGLAMRIAAGKVPENLKGKTIVTLDLPSVIAGAKSRGEFEERMKSVMTEAAKNPSVILFIDEIHTLVGAGAAEGAVDAANILKPALARGEIQLIGATTTAEYRKYIEKDAALERRFGAVSVDEPTKEGALEMLFGLRDKYESHHAVKITDEALKSAVNLSVRYIGDRYLPDKAIDLIDEAASRVRIAKITPPEEIKNAESRVEALRADKEEAIRSQEFEKAASIRESEKKLRAECEAMREKWKQDCEKNIPSVGADDIADVVTAWTGIPVKKLEAEENDRILRLGEMIKAKVIGQDMAADVVASAIQRGRLGLKDPERPVGSFIFSGPTGVGKTELSRVLAEVMFGDRKAMIRFDMSEFMERHTTSKLIGAPPGYVGFGEGGQLTEQIRRRPYSVVLFDEIEKAHPDVLNILLQILEDGVLTDSSGRRVDFKNAVIIMTSNVGASAVTDRRVSLGFSTQDSEDTDRAVISALRETFRPEFLNRVDEIIVFEKLKRDDIRKITKIMLADVKKRIADLSIGLDFSDDAIELIADEGYDPIYGARPLRRVIGKRIEDTLAAAMLEGRVSAGDHVVVKVIDGSIVYTKV